mmetsp:Transcript_36109/g.78789  ORF Transcript_36109/g.78789 Transcript_36109/m.78789 type:complete len:218 (-) Transcript_36109:386-1039(-)
MRRIQKHPVCGLGHCGMLVPSVCRLLGGRSPPERRLLRGPAALPRLPRGSCLRPGRGVRGQQHLLYPHLPANWLPRPAARVQHEGKEHGLSAAVRCGHRPRQRVRRCQGVCLLHCLYSLRDVQEHREGRHYESNPGGSGHVGDCADHRRQPDGRRPDRRIDRPRGDEHCGVHVLVGAPPRQRDGDDVGAGAGLERGPKRAHDAQLHAQARHWRRAHG